MAVSFAQMMGVYLHKICSKLVFIAINLTLKVLNFISNFLIRVEFYSQFKRQNKLNAWLDSPEIRQFCKLESEDAQWLEETLIHLGLSIRAWQRLLKVARTIANIDQSDIITRQHLQEAVSYRAIDRLLIHLQKLLT